MANKKISQLTAAVNAAATDLYEIETAGGSSRKLTAAQLIAILGLPLNGAGSPVGVVTPNVIGQTYVDTSGTLNIWTSFGLTNVDWVQGNEVSGTIKQWKGTIATIPLGYHLCDGTNGTPNLTDKFVVGASTDNAGVAKTTITGIPTKNGGTITHAHGISDPGHQHVGNSGNPDELGVPMNSQSLAAGTDYGNANIGPGSSGYISPISGSTAIAGTGINGTNNATTVQPYYALAYIMKL
jgi:hypothetical protein